MYEQLAQYVALKYPNILSHFDLSGVHNPSHKTRNLYARLNVRRGFPDFALYHSVMMPDSTNVYFGLFLEIKAPGIRLKKRDGSWSNSHVAEQAAVLDALQEAGYIAQFAVGLEECIELVESYLTGNTPMRLASPAPTDEGETF